MCRNRRHVQDDDLIRNIQHQCKMLKTTFEEYFKENYSEFVLDKNPPPFILDSDDIARTLMIIIIVFDGIIVR